MLIKQLNRNYILLNHSNQRFNLLLELYEPYEKYYQEQMSFNNKKLNQTPNKNGSGVVNGASIIQTDTYFNNLHDSYQTIQDRIKKIYLKMDIISGYIESSKKYDANNLNTNEYDLNINSTLSQLNHIDLIKLFEYQIIEMKHEYELLLEDKVSDTSKVVSEMPILLTLNTHVIYINTHTQCLPKYFTQLVNFKLICFLLNVIFGIRFTIKHTIKRKKKQKRIKFTYLLRGFHSFYFNFNWKPFIFLCEKKTIILYLTLSLHPSLHHSKSSCST